MKTFLVYTFVLMFACCGLVSADAPTLPPEREILFATDVVSKKSPVFNVWAFGAKGDGVTDDSDAIQAAFDKAGTSPYGTVKLPAGIYLATVTANKYVRIEGAGPSATIMEAVNASEYALTLSGSGGNQKVSGIKFQGASNTKHGIYKVNSTTGGIANLTVEKCIFSECGHAFTSLGCFGWCFRDCYLINNNYDWYTEGLPAMQSASALIDNCYSSGAKIAALRSDNALGEILVRGGIIENTVGFVTYMEGHDQSFPVIFDSTHLEGNCIGETVLIDGTPTAPFEFYFSGVRNVTLRNLDLHSIKLSGACRVVLDGCTIDVDNWTLETDSGTTYTVTANHGTPYSAHTSGYALNDVYHTSRWLTSSFAFSQIAPGPMATTLDRTKTNKLTNGSMISSFTPTDANDNTVEFSSAYSAPIHGNCMTVTFDQAGQEVDDGVILWPNYTITTAKWYVWSLDLKSVTSEGYLSVAFRSTSTVLRSRNMRAYTDRWTRYWGVARHTEGTTSSANCRLWNEHATANPTFLIANMQLVEFASAELAEKFINEAKFVPESTMPLMAQAGLAVCNGVTSAGYIDLYEDSDNGSNYIKLIGPASTADHPITLPTDVEIDETGFLHIDADGLITTAARDTRNIRRVPQDLSLGSQGPDSVIVGYFEGVSYDIGDDSIFTIDVPDDCDTSEDLTIKICVATDEAYATASGEIQWEIPWRTVKKDGTEIITSEGQTGTIDSGDLNIPTEANAMMEYTLGTIAATNIDAGDGIGLQLKRVAPDDGASPTADPVIFHFSMLYTLLMDW